MTTYVPPSPEAVDESPEIAPFAPWRRWLWPAFGVLALLGLVGLFMRFAFGHLPAGYGSYVPWGLWIALYFHGVGIAAGGFAISAVGYILKLPGFRNRAALRLGIILVAASIGPALLAVGLDLGHMGRAWRIIVTPSFTSMMAFNSWAYIMLLATAGAAWVLSFRRDDGWLKPVLILGVIISIAVPSQSGAFFGVVDAKPYWHSALLPVMLLTSAITAGSATLLVVRGIIGDSPSVSAAGRQETLSALRILRAIALVGIAVYLVMEFAEFSIALWNRQLSAPEIELVLFGPYWWVFWLVHLLLGSVVAGALLLARAPSLWVVGAGLVAVTLLSSRLNVLIPGQSVAEIEGLQDAFVHPRLDYVYNATLMEYLVAFFCAAAAIAIFYVGYRVTAIVAEKSIERTSAHESL